MMGIVLLPRGVTTILWFIVLESIFGLQLPPRVTIKFTETNLACCFFFFLLEFKYSSVNHVYEDVQCCIT